MSKQRQYFIILFYCVLFFSPVLLLNSCGKKTKLPPGAKAQEVALAELLKKAEKALKREEKALKREKKTILKLYKKGFSIEELAEDFEMKIEEIKKIIEIELKKIEETKIDYE